MKAFLRLFAMVSIFFGSGIVLIKLVYGVSWRESLEIADQFLEDLLG